MTSVPQRLLTLSLAAAVLGAAAGPLAGQQSAGGGARPDDAAREPEYGVAVVRDVMVPMRDGVRLATDLYMPARGGAPLPGPWPAVIERTPYSKHRFYANAPDGNDYARRGYVMVVQDVRGKFNSEGVFASYPQEGPDGVDAVAWIREQPWSDGRIVATGSSYFASTAQAILVQDPPGLVAAAIRVGPGNYHEDGAWRGGAFLLSHNVNYVLRLAAEGQEAAADPAVEAALQANRRIEHSLRLMRLSPLTPGFSPLALAPSYDQWYQDWQNHELYDDYWRTIGNGFTKHFANAADVPVLLIGEWYDAFLGGTLDQLAAYSTGRQSPVHLVISGGEHGNVYSLRTTAGDVDLGPASPIHVGTEMMNWFDQHVQGKDRGVKPGNLVRAFRIEGGDGVRNADGRLQAGGTWQEFTEWPPADSSPVSYYLGADRGLTTSAPAAGALTWTHDPSNPVPSIGGRVSSGLPVRAGPQDQRCRVDLPHCDDDRPLRLRPDVLVFETPALARDVEVSGPVAARLWVSSSAVDTDFVVKLIDQYPPSPDYPEGYAMNVAEGIVRARFRSFEQPGPRFRRAYAVREEPLVPGETYEVTVDLWSTSYLFRAGHRIRVDVSSSSFPQFDVNPNTGEPFARRVLPPVVARNTIHLGADHASSISLQVR